MKALRVKVVRAGNHSAVVGSSWLLARGDVAGALSSGIAPLTTRHGGCCHVPIECCEISGGDFMSYRLQGGAK